MEYKYTFEVGSTYWTRSVCDHDCVWQFEVLARTAKTITVKPAGSSKVQKFRISNKIIDSEVVYPFGHFSMAPVLRSSNKC